MTLPVSHITDISSFEILENVRGRLIIFGWIDIYSYNYYFYNLIFVGIVFILCISPIYYFS